MNTVSTSTAPDAPTAGGFAADIRWLLLALAAIGLWDLASLDLPMARWFGTPGGFPLRDSWWWSTVLHEGARRVAWALQSILLLSVWWPFGALRRLTRRQRATMFVAAMACLVLVSGLKSVNTTSCPWDLAEFGGAALHVSHWQWGMADGGAGHCFPAGHASAAFCFLPGYFWLRGPARRVATAWLVATLVAAFTLGLAQQVRGAHFFSHTLWTGWLCWLATVAMYRLFEYASRWRISMAASR